MILYQPVQEHSMVQYSNWFGFCNVSDVPRREWVQKPPTAWSAILLHVQTSASHSDLDQCACILSSGLSD